MTATFADYVAIIVSDSDPYVVSGKLQLSQILTQQWLHIFEIKKAV